MANNENDGASAEQPEAAPVVALGASAGGVVALQSFFDAMPERTGAAFVVVMHLDPEHRSELPRVLAAHTDMPVMQVKDKQKLLADHVYVIPPDCELRLTDHQIATQPFTDPRGKRTPIDAFFRSVGERLGDGFAVILSGAGSDGAIGVRAVKEAGGIIFVQEPSDAEYPSMPRNAIASGVVDFVLPVHALALRLADLLATKRSQSKETASDTKVDEDLLRRILAYLRVRTGHDFSKYKRSTVLRRIARRMQVTRTDDLKGYYDVLRENADEAAALLGDLLISVTTFFRDTEAFATLKKTVLPQIFEGKDSTNTVRVWVCGCATGEEAYSIAMLLLEEASQHEFRPSIQVFGSDLDAKALTIARDGRYPSAIEADVSEERLRRFFTREGDGYRVRQELRDVVLFALHDLLKDPPFSRVDFISCRNVLIYVDRELQEQVCNTFHYALNAGGYLLLGSSETADNPSGLFRWIDRTARIYQSTVRAGDRPRLLPSLLGTVSVREHAQQLGRAVSPAAALNEAAAHRRAIENVAPPSILVDDTHRAIHLSENAGRFILPSGGPMSGDVVDLVRPELRFELRSALHRAFDQRQPTLSVPIAVPFNGHAHRVHLLVKPALRDENSEHHNALVMFIEGEPIDEAVLQDHEQTANETVRRLTQELELTQSRLRTVREESDAANEELRAANEELQSINEEYRSTSEELETSKEELQSINEELQTVNSELKLKLEAISRAHSDLQNLMAATDFGTLFLDSTLRIKRFTDHVTDLFSITPSDEGRPITDFAHQLEYDELIKDVRAVLADLAPVRREVRSRSNGWYDVRLRPYRTVDNKIDGVVITFVEITERRRIEEALRDSEQLLQQQKRLVELSREPIFVWEFDGSITTWNRGCEELYGYTCDEALNKRREQLLKTNGSSMSFVEIKAKLLEVGNWSGELIEIAKDGSSLTVESRLQLETFGDKRLVLENTRNVTEAKLFEKRQQVLMGELTHRVKNILAVVQAIAHQTFRHSDSSDNFIRSFEGRLSALAGAHGLLIGSNWRGADLATLARQQLEPYLSDRPDRLRFEGKPLSLPASLATPFGLVLHELATNAAKYGALSTAEGKVYLEWVVTAREQDRILIVVWREDSGPSPQPPSKAGLGTSLIERGIPNAIVTREFLPSGMVCTIEVRLPGEVEHGITRFA